MSKQNDGGPAFPIYVPGIGREAVVFQEGMSLRDWFAGQALEGILAYPEAEGNDDEIALTCYKMAVAMLKAREAVL